MKSCISAPRTCEQVAKFKPDPTALNVEVSNTYDESLFRRLTETFPTFDDFVEKMSAFMNSGKIANMHILWILWWFLNQVEHSKVKVHNEKELLALEKQEYGFVAKRCITTSCTGRNVYNIFFAPCATAQELWAQCQKQFEHETEDSYYLIPPTTNYVGKWLGSVIIAHVKEISKDYHLQYYPGIASGETTYNLSVSVKIPRPPSLALVNKNTICVEIEITGSARAKTIEACMYNFVKTFPTDKWLEDKEPRQYRAFLENVGRLTIKSIGYEMVVLATTLDCTILLECARKHFLEPHLDMLSTLRTERWELAQLQKYAIENWRLSCADKTREEIVAALEHIFNSTEWLKIIR